MQKQNEVGAAASTHEHKSPSATVTKTYCCTERAASAGVKAATVNGVNQLFINGAPQLW